MMLCHTHDPSTYVPFPKSPQARSPRSGVRRRELPFMDGSGILKQLARSCEELRGERRRAGGDEKGGGRAGGGGRVSEEAEWRASERGGGARWGSWGSVRHRERWRCTCEHSSGREAKHRAARLWRRRTVCVGMRKGRRLLVVGVALVAALRVALPVLARCPAGCWLVGYQ